MKHTCTTLIRCVLVICALSVDSLHGQQDANSQIQVYSYKELGHYILIGNTPQEFKEFKAFEVWLKRGVRPSIVQLDLNGNLEPRGELFTTQRRFKLVNPIVGVEKKRLRRLTFKTVTINGISYGFEGRFLDLPKVSKKAQGYIHLEGTLTKYQNGKKIAESYLEFQIVTDA